MSKKTCNQDIKQQDVKIHEKEINDARVYNTVEYNWFCYFEEEEFNSDKRIDHNDIPNKNRSAFRTRAACFSGLVGEIYRRTLGHSKLKYNRLFCKSAYVSKKTFLTPEQVEEWVELSRKHKMLPEYIKADYINQKKNVVFDISELLMSILYIYICVYRNIYEHPSFVKTVLNLIREFDMNYYIAYVMASKLCFTYGTGHHPIYTVALYGKLDEQPSDMEIPIHDMIGLYRFISDPKRYTNKTKHNNGFNCGEIIDGITKINRFFKARELINPLIIEAILAKNDEKSNDRIEKFDKEKERYKYV